MALNRKHVAFGLILVPVLAGLGWVVWSAFADPLAEVRGAVGTRAAAPVLERLREAQPNSAEVFFLSARQARLEEKPGDASSYLTRAEKLGWPANEVERERALARATSNYPDARQGLEMLLAADPDDTDALVVAAQGELQFGQPLRAIELATRALALAPSSARAVYIRGSANARARRLDPAREDLEAAVAAGPDALDFRAAQLALGTCLLDLGGFPRALELFRAVRTEEPANLLALFGIGRAASYLGQWSEAEEAYQAVLRLRPGHVETLLGLAQVVEQRGDLPRALGYLEAAEKNDPNRLETLARLVKLLTATGQAERAKGYEARYRALDPNRVPTGAGQQPKGAP